MFANKGYLLGSGLGYGLGAGLKMPSAWSTSALRIFLRRTKNALWWSWRSMSSAIKRAKPRNVAIAGGIIAGTGILTATGALLYTFLNDAEDPGDAAAAALGSYDAAHPGVIEKLAEIIIEETKDSTNPITAEQINKMFDDAEAARDLSDQELIDNVNKNQGEGLAEPSEKKKSNTALFLLVGGGLLAAYFFMKK